jgi:hypothetical protein
MLWWPAIATDIECGATIGATDSGRGAAGNALAVSDDGARCGAAIGAYRGAGMAAAPGTAYCCAIGWWLGWWYAAAAYVAAATAALGGGGKAGRPLVMDGAA